jgi:quinol monooxygenase YgiN
METAVPLVAILIAKTGKERQVESLLKAVIEPTLKEDRANYYRLYQDRSNPCCFVFQEEWKNQAALDSHNDMPHMKELFKSLDGLLEHTHVSCLSRIA